MGMRETKDGDMNKCGRKELITETGRGLGAQVKQRQTKIRQEITFKTTQSSSKEWS